MQTVTQSIILSDGGIHWQNFVLSLDFGSSFACIRIWPSLSHHLPNWIPPRSYRFCTVLYTLIKIWINFKKSINLLFISHSNDVETLQLKHFNFISTVYNVDGHLNNNKKQLHFYGNVCANSWPFENALVIKALI